MTISARWGRAALPASMMSSMPDKTVLSDVKRRISARLLDEAGVSGVGIRGDRIVVYLETDDAGIRQKAKQVAQEVAPATSIAFEVAGRFGKQ